MNRRKSAWHCSRRSGLRRRQSDLRHRRSDLRGRRSGLTLLEVLAALAILATLLAGLLLAKGKAMHQLGLAERRLKAVAAADALMEQWWEREALPKREASGDCPGEAELWWRIGVAGAKKDGSNPLNVVSLEVIGRNDGQVLAKVQWWAMPGQAMAAADKSNDGLAKSSGQMKGGDRGK
jgi:prepilin-type N-terminal cleavage/methylation domain-containing protein